MRLRPLPPFSRSLYFSDKGRERGLAVELVRDFERYLNVKHAKALGKRPLTIYVVPATRDKLLPDLEAGLADIAVGNLTITDERLKVADFVPGEDGRRTISEIVVTGPASPKLERVEDLSGKTVHVRRASSYYESLERLNERLARDGKAPAELVLVPDSLEDEDLLDMLDAGLLPLVVVDDWKAPRIAASSGRRAALRLPAWTTSSGWRVSALNRRNHSTPRLARRVIRSLERRIAAPNAPDPITTTSVSRITPDVHRPAPDHRRRRSALSTFANSWRPEDAGRCH